MRFHAICPLFFATFLATACSTTQLALEPIQSQLELPLTYRTGWEQSALESTPDANAVVADASATHVRVTFVHLSTAESEELFGPIGARPAALEVAPADVERLLAAVHAQSSERLVDVGSVAVAPDKPGEIRVAKQCAYVAAFELSQTSEMAIADPIVQVAEDGCLLRLAARSPTESATIEIGVDLVLLDLERPMREHEIKLPGSSIPVTIQEPAYTTQRIQTNASLSNQSALLIAGIPAREAGQTLLVVLRRE